MRHLSDEQIQGFIDRRRRGETGRLDLEVEHHLQVCGFCAERSDDYETLYQAMPECRTPELSNDFTLKLMRALPEGPPPRYISYGTVVEIFAPVAALITLLMTVNIQPLWRQLMVFGAAELADIAYWWSTWSLPPLEAPDLSLKAELLNKLGHTLTQSGELALIAVAVGLTIAGFSVLEERLQRREARH